MLDPIVLIVCVSVVVATVFYIFYWNRLVARLLGLIVRFLYWSQGASSVWVHIGSVRLSLLSGRIFLKDIRYHSSNQTVRIVKAQIIWKYWLRRPLTDESITSMFGDLSPKQQSSCRIQVSLEGYEWFLYNRTAAFDNILAQMASRDPTQDNTQGRRSMDTRQSMQTFTRADFGTPTHPPSFLLGSLRLKTPTALQDFLSWFRRQMPNLDPKQLMPIGIDATKGVVICGNNSTPNLLVAEFDSANGHFGITQSRSKFDLYKQMLTLGFCNVLIHYVESKQYADTMPAIGEIIRQHADSYDRVGAVATYMGYHRFGKLWKKIGLYSFFGKFIARQVAPKQRSFMRKTKKSLDEGTPIGVDFASLEYAIDRKILVTPSLELCYYADAAGQVPSFDLHTDVVGVDSIGNGDSGPEWGVDMIVRGGYIRYGPWADRQRGELQKAFFPPAFQDAEETPKLQPGDERLWTDLRVFVELRDDTTLHIPFREASKNWQWDGLSEVPHRPKKREHAVIRVVAGDQSSVCYTMPMIAGPQGYEPTLEVHLDAVAVTSSLNDIRLISAESCRVRCELPSPLKWNAPRIWEIAVSIRQPVLFLLRDHINMFTDLGKDWASGPPNDFLCFVPVLYNVQVDLHKFELNLYVNDHNIIDKPLVRGDNAFAILCGNALKFQIALPSDTFRPIASDISFTVGAPDASISLSLPKWHTHALHAPENGTHVGTLNLHLAGSYRYFSAVQDDNVEQLQLAFVLKNVAFKALGWSIRYFMILRENYFGTFTHFATLYEYLERRGRGLPPGDPDLDKYRPGTSNMMQVVLTLRVEKACIIIPAGLPGYDKLSTTPEGQFDIGQCLVLDLPELQVYLRLHDYFMDLTTNFATISGRTVRQCPEVVVYQVNQGSHGSMILIDGIDITANRLFGPLPSTVTYFCVWEIQVGLIKASLSAANAFIMSSAITAFRLNLNDAPNAPAAEYTPALYPDITFVKIVLEGLDIVWKVEESAIHVSLPSGLRMDNNNLGGKFHRTLTSLRVPAVEIKVLANITSRYNKWLETAALSGDVSLDIYTSPAGWRSLAEDQLNFVDEQDALTGRAASMFRALWGDSIPLQVRSTHRKGVHIPQPLREYRTRRIANARSQRTKSPHMSESEDEHATEAERDARLMNRRSEIVSPVKEVPDEDHGDMSSADESDNDDLSDRCASQSTDWTDSEDLEENMRHHLYSRFTRHYGSQFIESPSLWNSSPFFVAKDYKISKFVSDPDRIESTWDVDARMPETDIEVSVFHVVSRNGIEIRLTPMIIGVIDHLQDDLEKIPFSPELTIDSMLASYLGSLPNPRKSSKDRNMVDIDIASCCVHFVRHLDFMPHNSMGVASLQMCGLHILGSFQNHLKSLTVKAAQTVFDFGIVRGADRVKNATLSVDLSTFSCRNHDGALDIQWDGLTATVGYELPEYALAFIFELVEDIYTLQLAIQRRKAFTLQHNIRVVRGVLTFITDETIVDPLSAIQPSYLIQSGIPHHLRTDPLFRFLFHLRDCLWDISHWNNEHNHEDNLESLVPLLEDRLLALDPDSYRMARLTLLEPLFPDLRQFSDIPEPWKLKHPFKSLIISMKRLTVGVLDPSLGPQSAFDLTNVRLSARSRFLDLIEEHSSGSQLSLRRQSPPDIIRTWSLTLSFDSANIIIYPHLMGFAQYALRARNLPKSNHITHRQRKSSDATKPQTVMTSVEIATFFNTFRVQAIAANLMFEIGIDVTQTGSTLNFRQGHESTMNHSIMFADIFLRARSLSDLSHTNDVLASIIFNRGRMNYLTHWDLLSGLKHRLIFDLQAFNFSVPRSALRLYRFFQEWRADFIPAMESALRELVVELKQTPDISATPKAQEKPTISLQITGHIGLFGILLQVMHGTWISWEIRGTTLHLNSTKTSRTTQQIFGIQVTSQKFTVSPQADSQDVEPNSRVKLDLPPLSASGRFDGNCIKAIALLEFVELKVKPSHWDTLMAVQQKFGQDFNDFLSLIQETRAKQTTSSPKPPTKKEPMKFIVSMKIKGFRIGLEGLSSTVYLGCEDIIGGLDSTTDRMWFVTLSDLALSLASRSGVQSAAFNRSHRSAFLILDFKAVSKRPIAKQSDTLHIQVTKIHAVMQPSSIGQVGDFIDDMQSEMLIRQEQRAHELAAFKQKTQRIIQSFDVKPATDKPLGSSTASFLDNYSIDLNIRDVGVAFPLSHDVQLNLSKYGSHDGNAVRAFLFSISSIQFGTVRGVTGEATMKGFSFQFIHRFRQSVATDFSGDSHLTRNRMLYPEMTAFLRSSRSATSRQITMKANVSGFILDLDSTIPDYIFSLIDVYRQGKDRVAQLAQPKSTTLVEQTQESAESLEDALKRPSGPTHATSFCGSLSFLSGKVRTFGLSASQQSRSKGLNPTDDQVLAVGGEVFNLPGVSVWTEYMATPPSPKYTSGELGGGETSLLMIKNTVHSSQNTLRPTLLPFFTELVNRVEHRLRQSSYSAPSTSLAVPEPVATPYDGPPPPKNSSMQISFSLRIDKSRLELTCKPDVNVVAALHWDSGGFVVNVSPGARNVTFSGTVAGLTVGLRHGFLSEDCVSLDARNLTFSVDFAKLETELGHSISTVSLVLDTEFLGGVRFSRLQDILCFKAVWLDRIPMFNDNRVVLEPKPTSKITTPDLSVVQPTVAATSEQQEYSTILLIRIRQIKLDIDLGQSVSVVVLDMRDAILSTKITEALNEVSVLVTDVSVTARGNISGQIHVANCVFQTVRRVECQPAEVIIRSRMLELRMTSGPLIVAVESEHQKLLHYRAEPLAVEIFDDWSKVPAQPQSSYRPLSLSFTIVGPEIVAAATIGAIPLILSYVNKFKASLELQREGATRNSETFRATRSPQPDNPLSAVAEAMIHSARKRIKEAVDSGLGYTIRQHMSLRLDLLQLFVFPRSMDDVEAAQFVGRNVHARLDRLVQSGEPSKRDICLSFTGMTISRFSQLGHTVSALQFSDNNDWLKVLVKGASEATIVALPSMRMHMVSEESIEEGRTVLRYDFESSFLRSEGVQAYDDIYIALNVGLYSWLAVLRKTLTREMEQVKAATEWMNSLSAPANISSLRRKGNDVPEAPRSAPVRSSLTMPTPNNARSASSFTPTFSLPPVAESLSMDSAADDNVASSAAQRLGIIYQPRQRHIERLNMRQLGEATPNVMHPFFMKKAGFSLEDSLPQYVNEYATAPLEEIMEVLLKLYSRQLLDSKDNSI